tara:strand:+ start:783 stop:1436 length:654 start_codon:yes stop_codon:yes gene_type:complete
MSDANRQRLKTFLFVLCSFAIWCNFCLAALLSNDPSGFQTSGTIIIAWGVFWYGRDRVAFEKSIQATQRNQLFSAVNHLNARLDYHESLTENTQNQNTLSHLKLLKVLNIKDQMGRTPDADIASLEELLSDQTRHDNIFEKLRKETELVASDKEIAKQLNFSQSHWEKVSGRVELWFIIIGTLQSGYGDQFVTILFSTQWFPLLVEEIKGLANLQPI